MPIVPVFDPYTGGAIGGGGSTPTPPTPGNPQWLDMPSKVFYIATVPSPDPGNYTWDEPTNGTGPYTYEGYVTGGSPLLTQWNFFDYTNRTIRLTRPPGMTSNGQQPMLIRIRAFDSVGNFGDQYIMVFYANTVAAEVTILPETVIEEDDPAVSFTFPPHFPWWIGDNSTSNWSYMIGSGLLSPAPMKDTLTARYQGPFTVDPAPGAALFFTTRQRPDDGGAGRQILIKSVRRKRAPSMTTTNAPWQKVIDYDLGVIGAAAPSSFTTPLTGASQTYVAQWTQPGFGADGMSISAFQQTAGTSTSEAAVIDASGAYVQLMDTIASNRAIQVNFLPRINTSHNDPNTAPFALRGDCVPTSDDVVIRMVVRTTLNGTGASVQVGITGQGGAAFRIAGQGYATGTVPAASIRQIQTPWGGGYRAAGQLLATEFNGQDFGYDIHVQGGNRYMVVYAWPGDWPDLSEPAPYGDLLHWTTEGTSEQSSGNGQQNFTVGYAAESVANNSDWTYGLMKTPRVRIEARLGGSVGDIEVLVKKFCVEHRPRMLVQEK